MSGGTVHLNRNGKPLCDSDEPHPVLGGIVTCEECRSMALVAAFGGREGERA